MRVLLTTLNAKYIHTNLAIRILYEMNAEREGLEWKEFVIKEDKEKIADFCSAFDVVAFSCYIWNIVPTLECIRMIKEKNPQTKTLLGGPEVSYDYDTIISRPEIDFIISGEGEIAFRSFLDHMNQPELVPGLVYKKDGNILSNPPAPNYDIREFADSMPYQFDDAESLRNKVLYLETSRGCPYKCEFCLASLDNKVRYLPMESIKRTLLYLMQHGKVIKFLDRTFNIKKDFTLEIFQFILDHHQPWNIFQFEITADILHPDIIRFINEKVPEGLFRFEIGIQSVKKESNLAVSRKQDFEKTKSIIEQVRHKVELHLDLIVGLPHDYFSDIRNGIDQVFHLYPPEFQLGFLKFLKGTPMREKHPEFHYIFDEQPPYQIIRSDFLSEEEIEKIIRVEEALEIYWNAGRAKHTLRYWSEQDSVFDILLRLGNRFHEQFGGRQYGLKDVFEVLIEEIKTEKNSGLLLQLCEVDYHLQHKVRPKPIVLPEPDKSLRNQIVEQLKLDHHRFRFSIIPLDFDWETFSHLNKMSAGKYWLILQYSGKALPEILKPINARILELN
ncbi:MAG: B12-binding domain-containing radical SAM protein [Flavobacteriales bacterium]|nr:B12-binding domain-containing radical SAM protein [Flavobacteriales bacterium]